MYLHCVFVSWFRVHGYTFFNCSNNNAHAYPRLCSPPPVYTQPCQEYSIIPIPTSATCIPSCVYIPFHRISSDIIVRVRDCLFLIKKFSDFRLLLLLCSYTLFNGPCKTRRRRSQLLYPSGDREVSAVTKPHFLMLCLCF